MAFGTYAVVAAEGAEVARVLGDLNLLDLLPQRGTIAGTVLSDHTSFLSPLSHV